VPGRERGPLRGDVHEPHPRFVHDRPLPGRLPQEDPPAHVIGAGARHRRRRRLAMAATVAVLAAGLGLVVDGPATSETPGVTRWISRPSPALPAGITSGTSGEPAMSADGTVLAFSSTSPNLVAPAVTGSTRQIYLYDSRRPATEPL